MISFCKGSKATQWYSNEIRELFSSDLSTTIRASVSIWRSFEHRKVKMSSRFKYRLASLSLWCLLSQWEPRGSLKYYVVCAPANYHTSCNTWHPLKRFRCRVIQQRERIFRYTLINFRLSRSLRNRNHALSRR